MDIGVANAAIVRSMFDSGRLSTDEVSVLAETPPYPDYVWAVRRSLHSATTEALRNAFLELTPMSPTHAAILEAQHCGAFLPAGVQEFDRLARAARNTGVLGQ